MSTAFPWSSDLDKFLAMALASHLVSADDLRLWREQFNAERSTASSMETDDLTAFCDYLVACGRLTRWQCDKLLNGQFRGFHIDHFVILEPVDRSSASPRFFAEDYRTKSRVVLRIKPSKDGKLEYKILRS